MSWNGSKLISFAIQLCSRQCQMARSRSRCQRRCDKKCDLFRLSMLFASVFMYRKHKTTRQTNKSNGSVFQTNQISIQQSQHAASKISKKRRIQVSSSKHDPSSMSKACFLQLSSSTPGSRVVPCIHVADRRFRTLSVYSANLRG